MALPKTVRATDLASLLKPEGFTDRWLRQMADEGYLVKVARGEYDLAASVQGYIRRIRETEVKTARNASSSKEQFEAERARKLKLENDKREAVLTDTADALAALDHILGEVRSQLASVAPKLSDDPIDRRRIEAAIDAALSSLADRLEESGAALQEGRDPSEAGSTVYA